MTIFPNNALNVEHTTNVLCRYDGVPWYAPQQERLTWDSWHFGAQSLMGPPMFFVGKVREDMATGLLTLQVLGQQNKRVLSALSHFRLRLKNKYLARKPHTLPCDIDITLFLMYLNKLNNTRTNRKCCRMVSSTKLLWRKCKMKALKFSDKNNNYPIQKLLHKQAVSKK